MQNVAHILCVQRDKMLQLPQLLDCTPETWRKASCLCAQTHTYVATQAHLYIQCTQFIGTGLSFSEPTRFSSARPHMNQVSFTRADSWGTRRNGVDRRVWVSNCRSLGDPVTNPDRHKEAGLCLWTPGHHPKPFFSRSESLDAVLGLKGLLLSVSSGLSDSCLPAMALLCVAGRQDTGA